MTDGGYNSIADVIPYFSQLGLARGFSPGYPAGTTPPQSIGGGLLAAGPAGSFAASLPNANYSSEAPYRTDQGPNPWLGSPTNAPAVAPAAVADPTAQTWQQGAAKLNDFMYPNSQQQQQQQQRQPQDKMLANGYNRYLIQHNQMVEGLARQLAQKTFGR
jgi:hypothetical protein